MKGLLVGVAVAAALVPAAPASSGPVPGDADGAVTRIERLPAPPPIERFDPPHGGGSCILPVSTSPGPCPDDPGPPVTCVLPVGPPPGELVVPDVCPRHRPAPEGRIVPLLSPTR